MQRRTGAHTHSHTNTRTHLQIYTDKKTPKSTCLTEEITYKGFDFEPDQCDPPPPPRSRPLDHPPPDSPPLKRCTLPPASRRSSPRDVSRPPPAPGYELVEPATSQKSMQPVVLEQNVCRASPLDPPREPSIDAYEAFKTPSSPRKRNTALWGGLLGEIISRCPILPPARCLVALRLSQTYYSVEQTF